ncbi:MAG: flavin reductase family protein [Paracoccaceae bacterium]|nr:flavin reductase family protein [Paracoccaceae bacterium]
MFVDFTKTAPQERYKLLTATVIPRPIALVSTQGTDGTLNAAPFSFFNVFSEDPALAVLGFEDRRDNDRLKDTTRNIKETNALVINLVDHALGPAMAACATALDPGESEFGFAGLTPAPSHHINVPGIAEAPVRLECRLFELRQITERRHLCIAEILALHAREGIIDPQSFYVDLAAYRPLGRLFGNSYFDVTQSFDIPVPPRPEKEPSI